MGEIVLVEAAPEVVLVEAAVEAALLWEMLLEAMEQE